MSNYDTFVKHALGFDRFFNEIQNAGKSNFPPYNIVCQDDGLGNVDGYVIEMAVAGFKKDEINIHMTCNDGIKELSVQGVPKVDDPVPTGKYLVNGIARRHFVRRFQIADNVHVKDDGITLSDGLLVIELSVTHDKNTVQSFEIK